MQINTKINNKYKLTRVKQSYRDNNASNLQQFNFKKNRKSKLRKISLQLKRK